ncbi:winged helix-turn-helix domain-containing protein [Acidihalobacter prosperus]|uniref:OmpR/PhoB-type domain-containing protein n=1 Tax=Acidihalobacter prosperus TaxID=160660 RepID=A0A1A6C485_9GAMM|nr:winged helix-turn-helix domain-containing protein [Acidihalobacter prosperus]OBS09364.1 hypothetical protein Thpro_021692 [Acidihalobacter prosperus]
MRWILISGDNRQAFALRQLLIRDGFKIAHAKSLEHTREQLSTREFSAILMSGFGHADVRAWAQTVERDLAGRINGCTPVFLLRSEAHCDLYHVNGWAPVFCTHEDISNDEILLRVRALLRRAAGYPNHSYIGPLGLDPLTHRAYLNGWPISLRAKEIELLQVLCDHGERAASYEQLEALLWDGRSGARARLASQVRNLRASLTRQGVPLTIRNVKGYGYRLVQPGNAPRIRRPAGRVAQRGARGEASSQLP